MVIVLPFCHKDAQLMVKVLRWAKKLDGHVNYKALIVHDSEANADAVRLAAEEYFASVSEFRCTPWPGQNKAWPFPQNHQYQECCGYMFAKGTREPWLWLEPDATPLKAGWLKALEDEYKAGGKPYMGHIVGEPYGHMTGVGIYPWNVMAYSRNALSATNNPWDVVSKDEVVPHCHRANHLIQHIWERNGGPLSFRDLDDVRAVVDPGAVLFHRCKDGSLIDMLDGPNFIDTLKRAASSFIAKTSLAISEDVSGMVTAVITTHNRPAGLLRAHNSCLAAGFKNIVVGASGISAESERVLKDIATRANTKVLRFDNEKSGDIWAKSVRAVETEMCCILHDDDQYIPGLLAGLSGPLKSGHKLIAWPGQIDDPALGGKLNEIGAEKGLNSSRLISNHLQHRSRSITPCRGCYPTKIAAAALEEAHANFDARFYYRDGFLVGNDMLLWLRLTNEIEKFYCLEYPGVILGTADSTTVKDIKASSTKLMDIYGHTREYWDTCPKRRVRGKVVVGGYVPTDDYPGVERWLENMRKFPPSFEQIYVADHSGKIGREVKAQKVRAHPDKDAKLCGSSIRFVDMVRAAVAAGADYMIVNEPDVRVNAAGWDAQIADEFFDWPYDAVAGGSPVIWNPFAGHAARVDGILAWGNAYREKSGLLPAYEITKDQVNYPIVYPNGALGIWDVHEFRLLFPQAYADPDGCYKTLYPYDDKVGRMWWGVYDFRVTRKVAWLAKAYSGCGDRWYNEAQRLHMLTSGKKIAVHQIKNNTL